MSNIYALQTNLRGGPVEITVRDGAGTLIAVVTHPYAKAPWWFVHRTDRYTTRERYRTRKAALAACHRETTP